MNYGRAIVICKNLTEEHGESEFIEAVGTILDMATINAVSKDALLNIVRYFWAHCVEQVEKAEWIQNESLTVNSCSRCGYSFSHEGYVAFFNFCPNCGAEMRGGELNG